MDNGSHVNQVCAGNAGAQGAQELELPFQNFSFWKMAVFCSRFGHVNRQF